MLVGAIEPDEHPHIGGVSNIGRCVFKEPPPKRAQPLLLALSVPLLTVALPKGVLRFW